MSKPNARVTIDCSNLEIIVHGTAFDATADGQRALTRADVIRRVESVANRMRGDLKILVTHNTVGILQRQDGSQDEMDAELDGAIELFGDLVTEVFGEGALMQAMDCDEMMLTANLEVLF